MECLFFSLKSGYKDIMNYEIIIKEERNKKLRKIKNNKTNSKRQPIDMQYLYIFIESILTKGLTLFICGVALRIDTSNIPDISPYYRLMFNICFILYMLVTFMETILIFYQFSKRKYITPNLIIIIKHYIFKR